MDYLEAMGLWWQELDGDEREQVFDFARTLRDDRRARVATGRGPNA
jgi:hypothetical protein